jgi:hypothetical protein
MPHSAQAAIAPSMARRSHVARAARPDGSLSLSGSGSIDDGTADIAI